MFPNRGMTLLEDRKLEYQERKKTWHSGVPYYRWSKETIRF